MLDEIGMTSRLLKRGIKSPIFQFRDRLTSEIVAEFDLGLLSGDTPHPFVLQIEQHKTVGTAYEIARKIGGFEIHRGQEVVAVSQDEDGVALESVRPPGQRVGDRSPQAVLVALTGSTLLC